MCHSLVGPYVRRAPPGPGKTHLEYNLYLGGGWGGGGSVIGYMYVSGRRFKFHCNCLFHSITDSNDSHNNYMVTLIIIIWYTGVGGLVLHRPEAIAFRGHIVEPTMQVAAIELLNASGFNRFGSYRMILLLTPMTTIYPSQLV
jgi:hypothetical protein